MTLSRIDDPSMGMASQEPIRKPLLDLAVRPSPVEPHAVAEKHPLHGTARLNAKQPSQEDFFRLLLDDDAGNQHERSAKRRKSGGLNALDLPRLPAVHHGAKRLRIPPTLSGLHQPPPNAGLLPSMLTKQQLSPSENTAGGQGSVHNERLHHPLGRPEDRSSEAGQSKRHGSNSRRKHNKWSEQETADLLKGVARFGIGKWTQILHCSDYDFSARTALDLKDRFRVCRPDDYAGSKADSRESHTHTTQCKIDTRQPADAMPRVKTSSRVTTSQLQRLGIEEPFEKSKRRQRTAYSAEEDEALLQGFLKHGNSWAAIRMDHDVLQNRKTTDLRDRFRTKHPDEYARAGLAPRPEHLPPKARRARVKESHGKGETIARPETMNHSISSIASANARVAAQAQPAATETAKPQPTAVLHVDEDPFWAALFEPDHTDSEPITLDRDILDWAFDGRRPELNIDAAAKDNPSNPPVPLDSSRSIASKPASSMNAAASALTLPATTGSSGNALPSLASITAVADTDSFTEPLELPSLMGSFGSLESEVRPSGHCMSMEELLS